MKEAHGDASRQAIFAALRAKGGGAHKRELCRITGKGWGTIGHHVYNLAKAGAVGTEVHGRRLWVFLPGLSRGQRDFLVATGAPERRQLLDYIRRNPPMTINALSVEMDLSKKVVRTHLQHLQRYGAVRPSEDHPPRYTTVDEQRMT